MNAYLAVCPAIISIAVCILGYFMAKAKNRTSIWGFCCFWLSPLVIVLALLPTLPPREAVR